MRITAYTGPPSPETATPIPPPPPDKGRAAAPAVAPHDLEAAIARANESLARAGQQLDYNYDRQLNRVIVRLIDQETKEVVRQMPSEEAIAFAKHLQDGAFHEYA
jgi:flagellar protein FlaG